ncbi:MAG TPA: S8 family serine peptidase [Dehalococcoidia bacterium]|nr:S8 family serine peptidase [Dehalococcoidia bacterium]
MNLHPGHAHDDIRIAHIRHGELVVVLELEGRDVKQFADRDPRDLRPTNLDERIYVSLIKWLEGLGIPLCERPNWVPGSANGVPACVQRANGDARVLQLLPSNDANSLCALMTINLAHWEPRPWSIDYDLSPSILEVAKAVNMANTELKDLEEQGRRIEFQFNGIAGHVVCVAPNWIGSGGNGCACGGPGGYPVNPAKVAVQSRFFQKDDVIKEVNEALCRLGGDKHRVRGDFLEGKGVTIAVIDSWPVSGVKDDPFKTIRDTIDRLGRKSAGGSRLNRLLEALDSENFDDVIDGEPELGMCIHRHGCDGPLDQSMDYADHGLFIAGILHEIAPKATLRVYRAFNDKGCSTADLITTAVRRAVYDASHKDHQPLVINCSFSVGPETHMIDYLIKFNEFANEYRGLWALAYKEGATWIDMVGEKRPEVRTPDPGTRLTISTAPPAWVQSGASDSGVTDYQNVLLDLLQREELRALHRLFRHLYRGRILAVAAAGNDSCRSRDPMEDRVVPPRFPAAFPEVLGVSAALPSDPTLRYWYPAEYTNNDDIVIRRPDGLSAMGGHGKLPEGSNDFRGMVGPYVSELPGGNRYGHALWAGTSFSTPVVAALAACVWAEAPEVLGCTIMDAIVNRAQANDDWTPGAPARLVPLFQHS